MEISVTAITDCASLWDHVQNQTRSPKDERTRIPMLVIRDDLKKPRTDLRWSPTNCMLADVGTKPGSPNKPLLLEVMKGRWKWEAPLDAPQDAIYQEVLRIEREAEEAEHVVGEHEERPEEELAAADDDQALDHRLVAVRAGRTTATPHLG